MKFMYLTDHLILQILDESAAPLVLEFYSNNKIHFNTWEPERPNGFYTIPFQKNVLNAEHKLLLSSSSVRYYLFEKQNPEKIIGTVCFYQIKNLPYNSCNIGYKIDKSVCGHGYAYEALHFLIPEMFHTYHLYRIEADIMPSNNASLKLIRRLGFTYEGRARGSYEICGKRTDHERFSLLLSDPLT